MASGNPQNAQIFIRPSQYRENVHRLTTLVNQAKKLSLDVNNFHVAGIDSGKSIVYKGVNYKIYLGMIVVYVALNASTDAYEIVTYAYYDDSMTDTLIEERFTPDIVFYLKEKFHQSGYGITVKDPIVNVKNVIAMVRIAYRYDLKNRITEFQVRTKDLLQDPIYNYTVNVNMELYNAEYEASQGIGMLLLCMNANGENTDIFRYHLNNYLDPERRQKRQNYLKIENTMKELHWEITLEWEIPKMLPLQRLSELANGGKYQIAEENIRAALTYLNSKGFKISAGVYRIPSSFEWQVNPQIKKWHLQIEQGTLLNNCGLDFLL